MSTISLYQAQELHVSGQGGPGQQQQQADSKDTHAVPRRVLPTSSLASNPGLLLGERELGMEGLIPEVEGPCLPKCPGNEM